MRLSQLELLNFRGFKQATISFDDRLTIFVGINGAGKTSVLDALSLLLDQYAARLLASRATARRLTTTDVMTKAPITSAALVVEDLDGRPHRWTVAKQGKRDRILKPMSSRFDDLNQLVSKIAERAEGEDTYLIGASLPIYYDQRRAVLDVPKRKRGNAKHAAEDAFFESRRSSGLDFRAFTYWFQERESEELRRQRSSKSYYDPQLRTVREAVQAATGLKDLSYRMVPPRGLTVKKSGVELHIEQLSTGERSFLSLACDLARRLAMISPSNADPRLGRAIVLIDEVELHLHPKWQRSIIPWLLKAFPNCQFVASTHSAQVIGEVEAKHVRVLTYGPKGNKVGALDASLGRDSNFLLEDAFGAPSRSKDAERALNRFEKALVEDDLRAAEVALLNLPKEIEGSAPEIAIAAARLERRSRAKS